MSEDLRRYITTTLFIYFIFHGRIFIPNSSIISINISIKHDYLYISSFLYKTARKRLYLHIKLC